MGTRGIQFLKQKGVAHTIVRYDHKAKGAEFAARAVGFPLAQTIKTLVVRLDDHRTILALMPGHRELSMKKLARAMDAKRGAMADSTEAQRVTGYLVGGISPFGTRKPLPVVMETGLLRHDLVMINAGRRGIMVQLSPRDIARILHAREAEL